MKVGIFGTGSIGSILARGLLKTGVVVPSNLWLFNRTSEKADKLALELGANSVLNPSIHFDCLVLAVKPKDVVAGCKAILPCLQPRALLISFLAGVSVPRIQELLGGHIHVIRAMPNIASVVGEGITVWYAASGCTSEDKGKAKFLFEALGVTHEVASDELIDVGTALFGSGPAYVMFVAQHLRDVAIELGIPHETAVPLIGQLLKGSSQLLIDKIGTPEELRRSVTSPNGTTAAGMERLAQGHVGLWVRDAVRAAYARAKVLSKS